MNVRNISGMLLSVLQEESQSGMRKLNPQVCAFVASSHVLIFAVIGHNKHPFDISSDRGFPGHTVRLDFFLFNLLKILI